MSNRVEELESRVAELQAAVDGLTEELVETRERLRALEDEAEDDRDTDSRNETVTPGDDGSRTIDAEEGNATVESAADADGGAAPDESESADGSSSDSNSNSDSDDIIVA